MWADLGPAAGSRLAKAARRDLSDPSQVVLIMLGAGINLSVGIGLVASGLTALLVSRGSVLLSSGLPLQSSILATSYFVVGSVYATAASLSLRPKRIVNPIYIQLVTASFTSIVAYYLVILVVPSVNVLIAAIAAFLFFLVALAMFLAAGFAQLLLVRYLVGLNGSREDTRSSTLLLNAKLEDIQKILNTVSFRTAFRTSLRRTRKDRFSVFRTSYNEPEQFYLLVMKDRADSGKTQLATVSYRLGYLGIVPSEGKFLDEMRSEELQRIFTKEGVSFSTTDNPEALTEAQRIALEPTQTRLLSLRSFEPHVKWVSAGISLMFFLVTAIWYLGLLPLDLYETFLIFFGFSFLFELLPMVRRRKKNAPS